MFRPMRRAERQLTAQEAKEILKAADYGVLAVHGENGYPYGVPVNYAYVDDKLYFHATSFSSHKLDALRKNEKVCFTVVTRHDLVLDELSTNYESVIVFGTAKILTEPEEKSQAMEKMMEGFAMPAGSCSSTSFVMVEITPEHITGKARRSQA